MGHGANAGVGERDHPDAALVAVALEAQRLARLEHDDVGLGRSLDAQAEGGVAGVVPCGTTGESPTLTEAEHALDAFRRAFSVHEAEEEKMLGSLDRDLGLPG